MSILRRNQGDFFGRIRQNPSSARVAVRRLISTNAHCQAAIRSGAGVADARKKVDGRYFLRYFHLNPWLSNGEQRGGRHTDRWWFQGRSPFRAPHPSRKTCRLQGLPQHVSTGTAISGKAKGKRPAQTQGCNEQIVHRLPQGGKKSRQPCRSRNMLEMSYSLI